MKMTIWLIHDDLLGFNNIGLCCNLPGMPGYEGDF